MTDGVTIFYSWQSDSPKETNLSCIRSALRTAINNIESKDSHLKIDLDEATRDTAGSPNIPQTIFEKISNAEIFICDLTTINPNAQLEARRLQNPNVLIELGYAIAHLGWNRIILLVNTKHSDFPSDLPFDIDRHRAAKYTVADAKDNSGKGQLVKLLTVSISTIISKNPLRLIEKTDDFSLKKRQRDLNNVEKLLETLNVESFDHFLQIMPYRIPRDIVFSKDEFEIVFKSSLFHLYDFKLFRLLDLFYKNWETSVSYFKHYERTDDGYYRFEIPSDEFKTDSDRKDYERLERVGKILSKNFIELIKYIREHYVELDIDSICQYKIDK